MLQIAKYLDWIEQTLRDTLRRWQQDGLGDPSLVITAAGIGSIESIHAARIRAAFNSLGIEMPVVPSAIMSAENRELWVLKV